MTTNSDLYGATRIANPAFGGGGMKTNALAPTSRGDLAKLLGADDDSPTLWEAVNYPSDDALDNFETHWLRYQRQDVASGLVDKVVDDTWQEAPEIVDESTSDDGDGESESEFDRQVTALMDGDATRRKPLHRLRVADKLATLGRYSLIVLGFDDGRDLSEPVAVVDEDGDGEPDFDGFEDLNYVATFAEDRVIEPIDVNTDMKSERYRLPEMYEVITEENDDGSDDHSRETQDIHWSRVIHVTEGTLEDDLFGVPYLKDVFHNLVNLDKIRAGSAEGYWRGGYAGMVIRPPTGPDGSLMAFSDGDGADSSELQDEIQKYERNMKRTIATTAEIDTLSPDVGDPTPHATEEYKGIAASKNIPQSVLMGNETGERATEEDDSMWKEHLAGRRNYHGGPDVIRPFVQRLIDTGILPRPTGDGFEIDWAARDELTEQEEADVAKTLAEAIKVLSGGQPDRIGTMGEFRELVLDWDPTVGAESDVGPEEQPNAADTEVDESDPNAQDAFDEMDAGNVPGGEDDEASDGEEPDAPQATSD